MYVFHKCAYLMTSADSWVMTFEQIHKWFVVFMVQQERRMFVILCNRRSVWNTVCLRLDPGRRTGQWARQCHSVTGDMMALLRRNRVLLATFRKTQSKEHNLTKKILQKSPHTLFPVCTGAMINEGSSMGSVSGNASWMNQLKGYIYRAYSVLLWTARGKPDWQIFRRLCWVNV